MEKEKLIEMLYEEVSPFCFKKYLKEIKPVLERTLIKVEALELEEGSPETNNVALALFIDAKRIEGCSERTLKYYEITLRHFFSKITKKYLIIETEDVRKYLADYQKQNNASKVTIDNVRRVISSLFTWLESEDYITKSPTRRIHKVKTGKIVKDTYSDESIELLRQNATNLRDLCIIDFLFSTGVRVGELEKINKKDLNLDSRECVVLGKGNKERKVYFDARTKLEIEQYLKNRKDNNDALFVSIIQPIERLRISGIEIALRKIGNRCGLKKVYPHKFRRTIATKAIDKGMPIEQVQKMLGHAKIDTTLEYAMVDEINVKNSHKKYLE